MKPAKCLWLNWLVRKTTVDFPSSLTVATAIWNWNNLNEFFVKLYSIFNGISKLQEIIEEIWQSHITLYCKNTYAYDEIYSFIF